MQNGAETAFLVRLHINACEQLHLLGQLHEANLVKWLKNHFSAYDNKPNDSAFLLNIYNLFESVKKYPSSDSAIKDLYEQEEEHDWLVRNRSTQKCIVMIMTSCKILLFHLSFWKSI